MSPETSNGAQAQVDQELLQVIEHYIYIWIYKNGVKELNLRPKVDDIKIKRKASPFLLPLRVNLPFIALLSLFIT